MDNSPDKESGYIPTQLRALADDKVAATCAYASDLRRAADELERLNSIIYSPQNDAFLSGVSIEAEHQRQRWSQQHDAQKNGWNWFWTIGYLSQKAATAFECGDYDKAKHHCISTAALMKTMHRYVSEHEAFLKGQG
ncbi:MAG: hypothetical protein AAF234_20185 [Pseudomonadota bacterium]